MLIILIHFNLRIWRDGRVVEGARLESVFTRNRNESSNLSLSASSHFSAFSQSKKVTRVLLE